MLKVAFWSSLRGKGVTSNMLAIAMATNQYFRANVSIRSNQISKKMVEYYISQIDHRAEIVASDTESFSRDLPQYMHYMMLYQEGFGTGGEVSRMIADKKDATLCLLRPPEIFEKEMYPYDGEDMFFLDLSGGNNVETFRAMEEADVNVVFLPMGLEEIQTVLKEYPANGKRTLYVVNFFSSKCQETPRAVREYLAAEFNVRKKDVCFIPYYERLRRACHLGEVDVMMLDEGRQRKMSLYYKSVKEIGKKLLMCRGLEKC